jgi:hypothetical protein
MSNKQQTATEWFFEQVCNLDWKNLNGREKVLIFQKAKAMEKEQMINVILDNRNNTSQVTFKDPEQYYQQTYGE